MNEQAGDKAAGWALIAASMVTVFAMAHHPTRLDESGTSVAIHGALLAVLWAMVFGFVHFARRRGLGRPAVLAGLVAYAFGAFANIGAATVNGLVTPALGLRGVEIGPDIYAFAWELNQALDAIGVFGTGAAFLLWSIDLLRDRQPFVRALAVLGITAGAVTAGLLASGAIRMNVSGALTVYAIEVAWAALLGLFILRGGLSREGLAPGGEAD